MVVVYAKPGLMIVPSTSRPLGVEWIADLLYGLYTAIGLVPLLAFNSSKKSSVEWFKLLWPV